MLVSCAKKPSAADVAPALKIVQAASTVTDAATVTRLVYQGCSEIPSCAQGCEKNFVVAADPVSDEGQRAALVADCSADYRKRRDAGEKLSPDAWMLQSFGTFLDGVQAAACDTEKASLVSLRKQAKL